MDSNPRHKLNGTVTTVERMCIDVSETEILSAIAAGNFNFNQVMCLFEQYLTNELGKKKGTYIDLETGKWYKWKEHYHGSDTKSVIREATPEEIEIMQTMQTLRELITMNRLKEGK